MQFIQFNVPLGATEEGCINIQFKSKTDPNQFESLHFVWYLFDYDFIFKKLIKSIRL